ncbi:hypothetical protein EWI07_01700 [Sporolactobacillus sp. THM7-4]|nr:hypothetical protein EWI07_01700 [Sporolactobacillus sp. THM7-4]
MSDHYSLDVKKLTCIKRNLLAIFLAVFGLAVFFVWTTSFVMPALFSRQNVVFTGHGGSVWGLSFALLLFSVVVLIFYITLYRILSGLSHHWIRNLTIGTVGILLITESTLILLFHGILPPDVDGGHVYTGAVQLLEQKSPADRIYFQVYPNNIPITVLRYLIYRYLAFGNPGLFAWADRVTLAFCLNTAIYFSWKLVVNHFNLKTGLIFLLITLTCFPLFLYINYFYSDPVAVLFPPVLIYLWTLYSRTEKVRYILILGLMLALGYQIRQNMIIFLPALIIFMCFAIKFRKAVILTAVIFITLITVNVSAQMYYQHLGFTQNDRYRMPLTHWVMIGLDREGRYSVHDLRLSLTPRTQEQKKAVELKEIRKRIAELKVAGMIRLWVVKAARTFADGSRGYYWYTKITSDYSRTYDYVYGDEKQLMLLLIQVFHIASLLLLGLSTIRFFRLKTYDLNFLIQICLFGSFLFYVCIWEAEPRYSLLFTPLALIGSIFGLEELMYLADRSVEAARRRHLLIPLRLILAVCLFFSLAAVYYNSFDRLTQTRGMENRYIVDQTIKTGQTYAVVDRNHQVEQTFQADRPFNHIRIGSKGSSGRAEYRLSVLKLGSGRELCRKTIRSEEFKHGGLINLVAGQPIPGNKNTYRILIRQVSGARGARLLLMMNGRGEYEQRDVYSKGKLFQNKKELKSADLQFMVYSVERHPYLNVLMYNGLFFIPVAMLFIYTLSVLKNNDPGERPINPFPKIKNI